jgi:hypothetical protein
MVVKHRRREDIDFAGSRYRSYTHLREQDASGEGGGPGNPNVRPPRENRPYLRVLFALARCCSHNVVWRDIVTSKFERAADVPPVQITTFRRVRKRFKHGDSIGDEPSLYEDFFTSLAPTPRPRGRA